MVLKIAHQVVRTSCSRVSRRSAPDPHPSPKKWLFADLGADSLDSVSAPAVQSGEWQVFHALRGEHLGAAPRSSVWETWFRRRSVQFATKSAMNQKLSWHPAALPSVCRSRGLSGSPERSRPKQRTDTVVARDGESRPWMDSDAHHAARARKKCVSAEVR